jgi:hypothetical protein
MLYNFDNKVVSVYHLGIKLLAVYHNNMLVWISSNSAFGKGYWDNNCKWENYDEGWNNG